MINFLKSFFFRKGKQGLQPECLPILARLFNEEYYLKNNPDVLQSRKNPFDHYVKHGFKERRLPCAESEITDAVTRASESQSYTTSIVEYKGAFAKAKIETLYEKKLVMPYHSKGNFFFKEISQHIANAAIEAGFDAKLIDEKEFKELKKNKDTHCFFVAPQEFFFLGRKDNLHRHAKSFIPNVTYLLAEQPQTVFFLSQLEYVFDDAHIVDMNFHASAYLQSLGVKCHYLPLGWSESLESDRTRHFGKSATGMHIPQQAYLVDGTNTALNRPIDAVFVGNGCERRQSFFASYAAQLSNFDMAVFMPDWKVPHASGGLATLDANDSIALCQRSKIFLNIHRDNFEYFEWHRICMIGFLSGSLVLTEPVFKVPEFRSGVHYLECTLEQMPEKIDWLLNTEEGREQLSQIALAGREAYLQTSMAEPLRNYLTFIFRG